MRFLERVAAVANWMVGLNDDQRQSLTTWALLSGVAALSVMVGIGCYLIVYGLPPVVVAMNAKIIIEGLFKVILGLLVLMGVKIVAQAAIAIGGKVMAKFGGAEISADAERNPPPK